MEATQPNPPLLAWPVGFLFPTITPIFLHSCYVKLFFILFSNLRIRVLYYFDLSGLV